MNNVQKYIFEQLEKNNLSKQDAVNYLKELKEMESKSNDDIAIIGVYCRLPMSNNVGEFWDNLINGRNCFTSKPIEKLLVEDVYRNKAYAKYSEQELVTDENLNLENYIAPFITDIDKFDAGFFGIPPREAKYIDPMQRVFLENAWSALEDAGYSVDNIRDSKTGVFVGKDGMNSINYRYITVPDSTKTSGTWEGILASRINYLFNLKGPSMVLDTACSSGLVAIHEACNALRNGDCDIAIAGGISMLSGCAQTIDSDYDPIDTVEEQVEEGATVKSKDNRIRSFDKKGSGTVFGEGVVSYVLKPLKNAVKDHDHIYAIIKGSAINNDGASNGITSPNPVAQEEVIIDAWKNAKVEPETISYIETHGTGTVLGDPIEIQGISNAFAKFTNKKQFCGVGAVKTNIGHTIGTSGCANVLKVLLSMNHHELPPTIYFEEPNPHINFIDSPVYVVDQRMKWTNAEGPLRAGISAFGFSGTNCHLILEEYKAEKKKDNQRDSNYVFTISAKTETAIKQFVKNYNTFFQSREELDIEEICYTASTGRGHYTYRIAILAKDYAELKKKVLFLVKNGVQTDKTLNIYYATNKIVSDRFTQRAEDEISESELLQFNKQSKDIVQSLIQAETVTDSEKLASLCDLYAKGAHVDWKNYYKRKTIDRISLPTYPFDRIRCWGDCKLLQEDSAVDSLQVRVHPLVDKCVVESMKESIYRVTFNLAKQWILQEHKIKGVNLVSGTTYIEICKEVLRQYYNSDKIVIENLVFLNPLVVKLEDDDVEGQIVVEKDIDHDNFMVVSKRFDEEGNVYWQQHLRGSARKHEEKHAPINRFETYRDNAETSEAFFFESPQGRADSETAFGPRWKCVRSISNGRDEEGDYICTELELPKELLGDLKDGYRYHPGMLDDAINTGLQSFTGLQLFLPFSYKNMKIYKNLPKHFFSLLRVNPIKENAEIIGAHALLADIDGTILADIEEVTIKKVDNFNKYVSNSYYLPKWKNIETEIVKELPTGNILVIGSGDFTNKVCESVESKNNKIYKITIGTEYKKISDKEYCIVSSEEDFEKVLDEFGEANISTVYHVATVDLKNDIVGSDIISSQLNTGLLSMFFLSKAMTKKDFRDVHFVMVTENANEVSGNETWINPAGASFLALARTLSAEFIGYSYHCIDKDEKTDFSIILQEMLNSDHSVLNVAYRDQKRYQEELVSLKLDTNDKRIVEVKSEGLYVITGGTGGLGLEVALNLTKLNSCNICLLARNPIPERERWDEVIQKNENEKMCNLLKGIQKMEGLGCEISVVSCDVSDRANMEKVFTELKNKYNKINGVVHCAGIAGDGFLIRKSFDTFNSVILPKIYGTIVLDEMTKDQELDFFILFSSIQSILGGSGQGDYTAANAFLDSYGYYLRKRGVKAHTINWPGWKETGMAYDYNIADGKSVFKTLATQTAISSLNDIICFDLNHVIPSDIDYEFISQTMDFDNNYWIPLSDSLQRKLKYYQQIDNTATTERQLISIDELVLLGKDQNEYTETEKIVGYVYAAVLNMPEIDIYESFASMGGNSILATELLKALNHEFNNILNITDMFTYASVEELSTFIDSKVQETEETTEVETVDSVMDKFEIGDIDIESMIDYFDDEE